MGDAAHGPRVRLLLEQLLPPGLVAGVVEGPPEAVLRALAQDVETPESLWDRQMASEAAAEVSALSSSIRAQHAAGAYDWSLPPGYKLRYGRLRGELFVGGVYVRLFLKSPRFAVRDPVKFGEGLMERYLQELAAADSARRGKGGKVREGEEGDGGKAAADAALLLSAAAVALLQGHGLLCDHLAQLGYASRLLGVLAGRTGVAAAGKAAGGQQQQQVPADELGGSALRLLHQMASSAGASEALATATAAPCVPTLEAAMGWGAAASVLALETIKRALAPGNRQRDALVAQALTVQLPGKLLRLLDWRDAAGGAGGGKAGEGGGEGVETGEGQGQEAAVQRALAVDVLRLMAEEEGAYSAQVAALLARSEVWGAYRGQRHDMFLPSGATPDTGVAGLLTAGETARFALPAPEAYGGLGLSGGGHSGAQGL